jgi:hypothetical protein
VIVVLDACVLYPPSMRDLLLTLATLDAFEVRWSAEILDELTRNVVADHPDIDPERFVSHTIGAMSRAFPHAAVNVDPALVDRMDNEPKDRHVAAAAIAAEAQAIVTINVRDFRSTMLDDAAVVVITPGRLVDDLLTEAPEVVITAIEHLAARWVNPARSVQSVVELLAVHPTMSESMATLSRAIEQDR